MLREDPTWACAQALAHQAQHEPASHGLQETSVALQTQALQPSSTRLTSANANLLGAAPAPQLTTTGATAPTDRVVLSAAAHDDESKTIPQHIGLASLGVASLGVVSSSVAKIARVPGIAREIPGLNLGLAGLEAFNAIHQTTKHKHVEAAGHLGNSLGCLAGAAADVGRVAAAFGGGNSSAIALAHWGSTLGVLGGVVGMVQSSAELHQGLELRDTQPKAYSKKMTLGTLGVLSGATTVGGVLLSGARALPGVGLALLAVASACDIASVGFEYKSTREDPASGH
jgi:hypothetical protein